MQAGFQITYVGHATCLIRAGAQAILTDPHLGRRCCWWERRVPIETTLRELPPLTAVLITHAHYDHCDIESFKYIAGTVPVIVPPGCGRLLHRFLANPIIELAHWAAHTVTEGITITPVPVRHFGGRLIPYWRYRQTSGYCLTLGGRQIYFAGDTRYGTHFREVGHSFAFDVALLPTGGFLPRWATFHTGLNGLEILQAFLDLKARTLIPIHWGTFGCTAGWRANLGQLRRHAAERGLIDRLHIIEPGSQWEAPAV